ncbi:winged helix-turn-helix transcriptional regulator [Pseudonocardia alaniniphila]|uniref:Winged helix-turn-helix domain-containing protein n=1 Tax=Pseudonocardia alaniniphila TaxID=75291 RepID=A0ABS9T9M6_9PSEU|nr:winged helix-turn-helix domain-containing protein [Pseudonocardia alaniniphila]MCH6165222.1 winged helix-turn-helix domain-containing protein [Pseudonocardia alaniniphila]
MSVTAWENDNSQFHARRRACLAGRAAMPDRAAVLLIDTPAFAIELRRALVGQPVEIAATHDPATGLLLVGRTCPDVVLLGPTQGRLTTAAFLEALRDNEPELPIVVGISPDEPELAGHAALLGAAVLAHPYRIDQLLRLLSSLTSSRRPLEVKPLRLELGRLSIDGAAPKMWLDGTEYRLPMREYLLLRYLAERAGAVVSRHEVIRAIWGVEGVRGSNTLNVHVMRLRRRLGDDDQDPQWIQSIRGIGYQFTVPSPSAGGGDT